MRKILAVAMVAVFAAALSAQDKVDTAKEGKFTAKFPTEPKKVTKTAGGLSLSIYVAEDKGRGGYIVIVGDLPAESLKAPAPEKVLESAEKDGLVDTFKAKVTKSAASTFGTKKYPARDIEAEKTVLNGEWNLKGKLVLVGNRLYQVYVYGSKDVLANKDADAFLSSFEITE